MKNITNIIDIKNTKIRNSDITILTNSFLTITVVKKFVLYPIDIGCIRTFLLYFSVGL